MPVVGDLEQIEACIADKRDSKFANQFDRGGSVNEIEHVIRSRLVHMAGCKGGKNIVEIRRSRTKRHQTLNLMNEPIEYRKVWRAVFRALLI